MEKYKDSAYPVQERVEDLLSRMTLEEKAAQLCGDLPASILKDGKVDKALLREKFPVGHGRITQYSMVGIVDPMQIAEISNSLQEYFVNETRLGIPVALQTENLCGYPAAGGTLFPAQINVGCTWEPSLAKEMATVIGEESRAVGINSAMSPVIDVSRDPRWGRTYETYGEDAYLISQMGIHYVEGMQNSDDKSKGVACIAKHFLGYADSQGGLNCAVSRINKRELYETFATPFEAAANVADVSGMMANYGEIDGMCVGANKDISRTLLRDTMRFRGMLTSDGAGIMKMYNYFHIAPSYEEAGLLAKKGGLDTEIPIGGAFRSLPKFVRDNRLDEELINESVRRILTIKFEYGLFENPYVDTEKVRVAMTNGDKAKLSRKIAEKSITLLKNDGVLPIQKGAKVAVIGPHADNLRYPISGYTYPAYIEMMKAGADNDSSVTFNGMADEAAADKAKKGGYGTSNLFTTMLAIFSPEQRESLDDLPALLAKLGSRSLRTVMAERYDVKYAEGCKITADSTDGFADAVKAAEESDVVVMALGGNCGWVNVTGGEGKDRSHLDLPGVQQQLVEAVCATGKPVVLILYGPGVFAIPWAAEHASALVQAFMPGAEAGAVLADVLDGTVNPGGHLTFSIPHHIGQIPVVYNQRRGSSFLDGADASASAIFSGGYVDDTNVPLFPFGHGLSYTTFDVSPMTLSSAALPTDGSITVSCTVTNTGSVAGDEVVQLYYHFSNAFVIRPVKQLVAFARVSLQPGESKHVTFTLHASLLGYYNEDMVYGVEPGAAELMLGTSSADIKDIKNITLTGKPVDLMGRRTYTTPVEIG